MTGDEMLEEAARGSLVDRLKRQLQDNPVTNSVLNNKVIGNMVGTWFGKGKTSNAQE